MNITEDMYKLIEGKVPETVNEIRNRTLNCFIDLFDEELDTEFTKYRERWKQRQLNQ